MNLNELKLPVFSFVLLVLFVAGGKEKALVSENRYRMDQYATLECAKRAAVGYESASIDRARTFMMLHAHTIKERQNIDAYYALVESKCGSTL